jgi:hypothetical protein
MDSRLVLTKDKQRLVAIRNLPLYVIGGLLLCLFLLTGRAGYAQSSAGVTATPDHIALTGTLPDGLFAASLRLSSSATITNVRILVSDLQDVTGDQRSRDTIPASNITLLPAAEFPVLTADSLTQLVVQAAKPAAAGIYSGTLIIRWEQPVPGQLDIPFQIVARTKPVLALQDPANPGEITINSQANQVERRLLLRETSGGAPFTAIQPLSQDLMAADQRHTLPASALTVDLARATIGAGELLTATLRVNLAGVPAGAYQGNLFFSAQPDTLLTVPITINVRHGWGWPIVVVVAGVLLGLWISSYVAQGKTRDEYVVRIAALREAVRADAELSRKQEPQHGFTLDLEQATVEAEAALRTADWTAVEEKLKGATALLVKWRGNRTNWVIQIHHLRDNLLPKLETEKKAYDTLADVPLTLRKLWQGAVDAIEDAARVELPQVLQAQSATLEENLAYFQSFKNQLDELGAIRITVAPNDAGLKLRWSILDQNLRLQDLSQAEVRARFEQDLNALRDQILQHAETADDGLESTGRREGRSMATLPFPPSVLMPSLKAISPQEAAAANQRLSLYHWATYLVGGLLLAAVGLNTLYVNNPIFGANWLTDYLSLLVFGLGAETTFASVADMLRRWGVPAGK